jgi:adenylate cyclase
MADHLLELLARVSDSLGIMTRSILAHGGVIGDFHGDAAMGFWGWPLEPTTKVDNAVSAISAALEVQDEVTRTLGTNPNLQNFQIGLGIASGEAVAGKIGTQDQVKVTAFGPVVNLAARLEGMTRWLDASILVDGETYRRLEIGFESSSRPATQCLGKFQPFGMKSSLEVFQIFRRDQVSNKQAELFAEGLRHFQEGDWSRAITAFDQLQVDHPGRTFYSEFMSKHNHQPPTQWNGVIQMQAK